MFCRRRWSIRFCRLHRAFLTPFGHHWLDRRLRRHISMCEADHRRFFLDEIAGRPLHDRYPAPDETAGHRRCRRDYNNIVRRRHYRHFAVPVD